MSNTIYAALTFQSGLAKEMISVAQNIANMNTTGYRRENTVFAEHIAAVEGEAGSLSMGHARPRFVDQSQGVFQSTGGPLDFAIEGDGFFLIDTPQGQRLTRAGSFSASADGALVTLNGDRVLGPGGGEIFLPPNVSELSVAPDGTMSANGVYIGEIGLVSVAKPEALRRVSGMMFEVDQDVVPAPDSRLAQGFLEASNVNSITEVSRMIEVQRAYELTQRLIERDHELISKMVRTLGRVV